MSSSVEDLVNSLRDLFTEEVIELWFNTPNERLDGKTPMEILKTPGAIELLIQYVDNHGR